MALVAASRGVARQRGRGAAPAVGVGLLPLTGASYGLAGKAIEGQSRSSGFAAASADDASASNRDRQPLATMISSVAVSRYGDYALAFALPRGA